MCAGDIYFEQCSERMARFKRPKHSSAQKAANQASNHLFAMPVESNFSGARFNPEAVGYVRQSGVLTASGMPVCAGPDFTLVSMLSDLFILCLCVCEDVGTAAH